MSIENALSVFLEKCIENAAPESAIYGAILHDDTYEEINKGEKWIRVDDMTASIPRPLAEYTSVREFRAEIALQFVVRPVTQIKQNRRAARDLCSQMANEVALLIACNDSLNDTTGAVCDSEVKKKINRWANIGTTRHAVSYLMLDVNKRQGI